MHELWVPGAAGTSGAVSVELGILDPRREEGDLTFLPTQHRAPQLKRPASEDIAVGGWCEMPHAFGDFGLQLACGPAGVSGEDPKITVGTSDDLNWCVEVQQTDGVEEPPP